MLAPTWAVGSQIVIPQIIRGESLRAHPLSLQEVAWLCVVSSESGQGEEEELGLYLRALAIVRLAEC